MGKFGLAGASLTAAVPSGFLAYLLVLAVMNQQAQLSMPMMFKVSVFALLALCCLLALFPLYLLIWFRGAGTAVAARKGKGAAVVQHDPEAGLAEDLVGQEFIDDEEPLDDWADSGEVGEVTDTMSLNDVEEVIDRQQMSTADFSMDEEISTLEVDEIEQSEETLEFNTTADDDLFGEPAEEFSAVDTDEDEFTPAGDLDDEFSFDDFDLDDEDDDAKKK